MKNIIDKYKTFRNFYWKSAIWIIGLPFGLLLGIILSLDDNKWTFRGILNNYNVYKIISFIFAGFLFAYLYGRSIWKRMKKNNESLKAEEQEETAE